MINRAGHKARLVFVFCRDLRLAATKLVGVEMLIGYLPGNFMLLYGLPYTTV
jgi:hypothetical protein